MKIIFDKGVGYDKTIGLTTNKGKTIKISASDMKTINRNTQGVRLQDMSDDEKITAVSYERTND